MLNTYKKFEYKLLIKKLLNSEGITIKQHIINFVSILEADMVMINELYKFYIYGKLVEKYHIYLISVFYFMLYVFHWILISHTHTIDYLDSQKEDNGNSEGVSSMLFHLAIIIVGVALFFFEKADSGFLNKKHILKDKAFNLIGYVLDIVE
jgi:hypothetical protein